MEGRDAGFEAYGEDGVAVEEARTSAAQGVRGEVGQEEGAEVWRGGEGKEVVRGEVGVGGGRQGEGAEGGVGEAGG